MVEDQTPEQANPDLAKSLSKSGITDKKKKKQPSYKVIGSTKIPVSSSAGKLWKSRRSIGMKKRESNGIKTAWEQALKYYNNDQLGHRNVSTDGDVAGNLGVAQTRNDRFSETENIVFANTRALVPVLYAKNPRVEYTSNTNDEDLKEFATMLERVVNAVISRKANPGVNLKPKARRAVVNAALTNRAWLEVGYIKKEQSSEETFDEITKLAEKLAKAKSTKEIERIEGELLAAERRIDVLEPSGPFVKFRNPQSIIVDPDAVEEDGSDAQWIIIEDFMSTAFIEAVYSTRSKNAVKSIFAPTHVLTTSSEGTVDDEVNNFTLFKSSSTHTAHGFEDEESFKRAQRTAIAWVWDKVTRRVLLFNAHDWAWPIWVWDDPYHLDTFYPLVPLSFYTNPEGGESKGEVTYYLDQQDAINEMNDEERRIRMALRKSLLYNKNIITPEAMDTVLNSTRNNQAAGVDIPEGTKMEDHFYSFVPKGVNFLQLFDPSRKLAAIDRIASVGDVRRGAQFKTNTTNKAIEQYNSIENTVLDEKIDAVEDAVGHVGWMLGQMCLQFMSKEQVIQLIGKTNAKNWKNLTPEQLREVPNLRAVGGSTAKPTSRAKKQEAVDIGQVLGQFSGISPMAIVVALKVFEQAFDEVTIKEEDWQKIIDSVDQAIAQGGAQGGAQNGGATSSPSGAEPPQGNGAKPDPLNQIAQFIDGLPPEAKQALGNAIAQGAPVRQALEQIIQALQGQTTPQPQSQPQPQPQTQQ